MFASPMDLSQDGLQSANAAVHCTVPDSQPSPLQMILRLVFSCATQLSAAFATRMSVCLSVCHTKRFNIAKCLLHCTIDVLFLCSSWASCCYWISVSDKLKNRLQTNYLLLTSGLVNFFAGEVNRV